MKIIPVKPNTPEWLAQRKGGIGGSDAAAALGLSSWRTPYQLWLDKTNAENGNFELDWWTTTTGHALEPAIRKWYAREYGNEVIQIHGICQNDTYPFMLFTPDGYTETAGMRKGFEAKKYLSKEGWGDAGTDEVPQDYLIQVQHGMIVMGIDVFDIAVSFWGAPPVVYHVEADKELHKMIVGDEAVFWNVVQNRIEPVLTNADDVKLKYRCSSAKSLAASSDIYEDCTILKALKAQIKALEAQESYMADKIKIEMGEYDTLEYAGNTIATWKSTKPSQRFDKDVFAVHQPEMYAHYLRETEPQRRFLLK